jgi:transposase
MYGVEIYYKVRRAHFVEGVPIHELSRVFGIHRKTVRKMLSHSVPPGYRRQQPVARPKLDPFTGIIDQILEEDRQRPRKQRHTAKRICERLQQEHGFTQGEAALTKIFCLTMQLPSILDNGRPGGYNAARHAPVRGPAFEPARDCPATRCCA